MRQIRDIAVGAAVLGAGGGGETYLAELQLERALSAGAEVRLLDPADLAPDALVAACGWMGAPTVHKEKYANGQEALRGLRMLEQVMGRAVDAVFPVEIGGQNGLSPMLLAAGLQIPLVDCDGMGRAFPEAQMVTFNIHGCDASPAIFTDDRGNTIVMHASTNSEEERIGRQVAIAMGGHCHVIDYPMSGLELQRYAVLGTISTALGIGRALRHARRDGHDAFLALFDYLNTTQLYRHARSLLDGKIVDLNRRTEDGFSKGRVILEARGAPRMEIEFQNENLVARSGGEVVASVPDIIAIMDRETALALTTENLRYGQRVRVIGISAPPVLRSEAALALLGPRAFGLDFDHIPIETPHAGAAVPCERETAGSPPAQ